MSVNEVAGLRAELEQARKVRSDAIDSLVASMGRREELEAELEQARKELDVLVGDYEVVQRDRDTAEADAQRYRDALERIASGKWDFGSVSGFARDALAGDK